MMNITLIPAIEADRDFFRKVHHEAYRHTIESMFEWDEARQDAFVDRDFDTRDPQIIWHGDEACGVLGSQDQDDQIILGPYLSYLPIRALASEAMWLNYL